VLSVVEIVLAAKGGQWSSNLFLTNCLFCPAGNTM